MLNEYWEQGHGGAPVKVNVAVALGSVLRACELSEVKG
jgi:hypothetical protein